MPFATAAEVRTAIGYPSTGAPVADADILTFVALAEEEVEKLMKTRFGNIEDSGTANGDYSTTTLSTTGKTWTTDTYVDYVVWIYEGTGSGSYRSITANTGTKLTFTPALSAATTATTKYRIVKLGYADEIVDGSGTDVQFTRKQPLVSLAGLTIDSVTVTPSKVYTSVSGKLRLNTTAEASSFSDGEPQLVEIKYIHGVYPCPLIIKRLVTVLAGMACLTNQIGGAYNSFRSVSLPGGVTASKLDPEGNLIPMIAKLQEEATRIVVGDGRNPPLYRPWTIFG